MEKLLATIAALALLALAGCASVDAQAPSLPAHGASGQKNVEHYFDGRAEWLDELGRDINPAPPGRRFVFTCQGGSGCVKDVKQNVQHPIVGACYPKPCPPGKTTLDNLKRGLAVLSAMVEAYENGTPLTFIDIPSDR
jgi:hypothetical protein